LLGTAETIEVMWMKSCGWKWGKAHVIAHTSAVCSSRHTWVPSLLLCWVSWTGRETPGAAHGSYLRYPSRVNGDLAGRQAVSIAQRPEHWALDLDSRYKHGWSKAGGGVWLQLVGSIWTNWGSVHEL